ncbi:MAG: AAA family ATPase [Aestuariivirga sp.]
MHGLPGTGKTELSRLIAQQMECELFEITSEDEEGNAIDGASRLRAYRAAQAIVANKSALLLFDETEDVFGGSMEDSMLRSRSRSIGQTSKVRVNSVLENNGCPVNFH